jgi:hypothetical protein
VDQIALIICISDLSKGLTEKSDKGRLIEGVEYINTLSMAGFDDKLKNLILMPTFARSVYLKHRFDIKPKEYVDHLADVLQEEFRPDNQNRFVTKHGRVLVREEGPDNEADYIESIITRTFDYIDMILPKA